MSCDDSAYQPKLKIVKLLLNPTKMSMLHSNDCEQFLTLVQKVKKTKQRKKKQKKKKKYYTTTKTEGRTGMVNDKKMKSKQETR